MATHSSVFAWRIPRTGEPGGLPSLGLHRVGHDWNELAAAAAAAEWKLQIVFVVCFTVQFSSVQSLSRVWLLATPWIAACQASLSITNTRRSLKLMSIESVMPSSHLILCRTLLFLPPIPPSIRVISNESTLRMSWPKYWSFSFSISLSSEHPGLSSFRMDWLDLLAVQGTLKSLPIPQFKSINSLVLNFLHSPTLTSIHEHRKNHSLD